MEEKILRVGLVIADKDEYVHIENALGGKAKSRSIHGLKGHIAIIDGEHCAVELKSICCGIGKVNAAVGTALLAEECDILINAGLSGGFGNVGKYDIVVGTEFVEHDFDLTGIGYKLSQKPGQTGRLKADETLNDSIKERYPKVKFGVFATGDSFVNSGAKHDLIEKEFRPIACDMESAACAYTANLFGVPFVSIRMISDGADDNSADTYSDTLKCDRADGWFRLTLDWIRSLRLI